MTKIKPILPLLWGVLMLAAPPSTGSTDLGGYLYGTVETDSGNHYTGFLRWGTEEAAWDDLFNSTKKDLPYSSRAGERSGRRSLRVLGGILRYRWDSSGRAFIARFGDIREIRVLRNDKAEVTMKSGTVYAVEGGSNDIGASITVHDPSLGEVKLPWKRIDRITFSAVPAGAPERPRRLWGRLVTEYETFEGFIQWDSQECLATDELDGDSEDGDLSIRMGRIRRIEKRGSKSSAVELVDGRRFVLRGSNDVDDSIRGIFVEDKRFGRVKVSWDVFESVEFREVEHTGRGYDDYPPAKPLAGTVVDYEDRDYTGKIIFDLDESESWEMLNGDRQGVEYFIPFGRVRSIAPARRDSAEIVMDNGLELRLEGSQDVEERNDGIVILRAGSEREVFLEWRDVRRIELE